MTIGYILTIAIIEEIKFTYKKATNCVKVP